MASVARAQGTVAPEVVELPEVVLPESAATGTSDVVEVTAVIDAEGRAQLEHVTATPEVTDAIQRALAAAKLKPALKDGVPVSARVRLRLRLVAAAPPSEPEAAPAARAPPPATETIRGDEDRAAAIDAYGARAEVKPVPVTAKKLRLEEMRELPGAFGDPFRVLDTLPGVVPVLSGLPYVYVRGSPPASTIYVYDDIAIPALFHLGLLNAVIHPAMLGDLEFYPSVAPARFGRKTGGVFGAQGPDWKPGFQGEFELRVIDAALMLSIPFGSEGARLTVAGRYGYPGPIVKLVEPDATLAYWDYQVRLDLPLGGPDRFVLTWFGSYDLFGDDESLARMTFHRAELRLLRELSSLQLGAALQLGYDRAGISDDVNIEGARFGPRMWIAWEADRKVRFRAGADMLATVGRISILEDDDGEVVPQVSGELEPPGGPPTPRDPMRAGAPSIGVGEEADESDFILDGSSDGSRDVRTRNMFGVYAEVNWRLHPAIELALGVRGDLWLTGSTHAQAVEPRVVATWHLSDAQSVHVGWGLSFQPAVFPVPVPGLADIVLDRGLQRANQSEVGYRFELSEQLLFETALFYNHLSDLLFLDTLLDCDATFGPSCSDDAFPRATADAYGWEVFLQRPSQHALSGWVSYTLGGGVAYGPSGMRFTPAFDVRHVANLVLQYELGAGFRAGMRVLYRSGRVASVTTLDAGSIATPGGALVNPPFARFERRLPGFFRADVLIAYRWNTSWGRMRLALEWLNVTMSREAIDLRSCSGLDPGTVEACGIEYAPAIFVPNLGLRAEF